jgi:hypothetical protein
MRPEEINAGTKYIITFNEEEKIKKVIAKAFHNDIDERLLKFEVKGHIYKVGYDNIVKIKPLWARWLKISGIILLAAAVTALLLLFWYRTPRFHNCGYFRSGLIMDGSSGYEEGDWVCRGIHCYCYKPLEYMDKPIIYLYPQETTEVRVELGYPENTLHTYPKYKDYWQVRAEPDGNLTDMATGRHYYALYWEGKNTVSVAHPSEGFVVKGEDTIAFLEEKLAQLGLNEREAEEFIVYWLPQLEDSPYNYIRFQTMAEQNKNMPLLITPKPQTVIRVMMEYDNLEEPLEIEPQILPTEAPTRTGFTVVEWGGTKISF